MFVGVGASRVRSLFEQAKKNAPCLIFVDEIDAVGRHRGSGVGGGNDEREQTLNQLLVEMDGFEANEGIILIAATNRADVLDEALLRPGRFDRQVYIALPDLKGREAILEKYIGEVKILSDVDVTSVARGTPGFSGAELANLVNEAALIAARMNRRRITQGDFEYARDKILMGTERRSTTMSPEEVKNTAYHEAGHALCSVLLPGVDPIHKATIIPRGAALGMVQQLPERDKVSVNITEIRSQIAVAMGGRSAEEIFFGKDKITAGATSDIEHATRMARNAVVRFGMDDMLGPVFYGETAPMWGSHDARVNISDETARLIDARIKSMVEAGHKLARATILRNKKRLEELAKALLEYETLTGDEVRAIVKGGKVKIERATAGRKSAIRRRHSVPLSSVKPGAAPDGKEGSK
jgi:cell division protease FtsH